MVGSGDQIVWHFVASSKHSLDGLADVLGEGSQDLAVLLRDLVGQEVSVLAADGDTEDGWLISVGRMHSVLGGGECGGCADGSLLEELVGACAVELVNIDLCIGQYYLHRFSKSRISKNNLIWLDTCWETGLVGHTSS